MIGRCVTCGFSWEATRLDPYVLRCGFCRDLTCERCGRHAHATIHVCPACYQWKGADLEKTVVTACQSCQWVRPLGSVGHVGPWGPFCPDCEAGRRPGDQPENPAAYARDQFQARIRNYFEQAMADDPGRDLLPFTLERLQAWEERGAFGNKMRAVAQAAFHRDAASEQGLIELFTVDRYAFSAIALALGRIDRPAGRAFLLSRVAALDTEPYLAELALAGLCETPGETALDAVCDVMARQHPTVTPATCLELVLKMEFRQPGFWFSQPVAQRLRAAFGAGHLRHVPQHLVYFRNAIPQTLPGLG